MATAGLSRTQAKLGCLGGVPNSWLFGNVSKGNTRNDWNYPFCSSQRMGRYIASGVRSRVLHTDRDGVRRTSCRVGQQLKIVHRHPYIPWGQLFFYLPYDTIPHTAIAPLAVGCSAGKSHVGKKPTKMSISGIEGA